ncbi:hypothetical protein GQ44DRAFT_592246, partial [Phaeosphaeriaceae sp. PMI808]
EYAIDLRKFAQDNLKGVFNPNDPAIKELAEKAAKKVPEVSKKWGLEEEDGPGLVKLMLYDFVILCDDSSSMQYPYSRIETLKFTLQRIVDIAMSMDLDESGISIRFLNYTMDTTGTFDNMVDPQVITREVGRVIENGGGTLLGTRLLTKIVSPMIYEKICQRKFEKPIMVVVITDGQPMGESQGELKQTIMGCKQFLDNQSYGPGSAIFLISQVGDD